MSLQALPYIILLGTLWGSTLVVSRFSVGQFHPTTYIGLRLLIAAGCHLLIYALMKKRPFPRSRTLWKHSVLLGVVGTAVPMTAIVGSLVYLSSGVASILLTINPAVTVLLAHFFLADEKLTTRKGIGVLLALGGAAVLALSGESGLADVQQGGSLPGYLLAFLSIALGGSATIYARRFMKELDAVDVASVRMWSASLLVLPLSVLFVGFDLSSITVAGYGGLIYAALVGTFSGMMLSFYNIKRFGATPAAMTSYVIPVVATIGGILFLGEQFTAVMVIGVLLIVAGIALLNRRATSHKSMPLPVTSGD